MQNLINNLLTLVQNNHIRWPALVVVVCEVASYWFPEHKAALTSTERALLIYLAAAASNAVAKPQEK